MCGHAQPSWMKMKRKKILKANSPPCHSQARMARVNRAVGRRPPGQKLPWSGHLPCAQAAYARPRPEQGSSAFTASLSSSGCTFLMPQCRKPQCHSQPAVKLLSYPKHCIFQTTHSGFDALRCSLPYLSINFSHLPIR